MCPSTKILLNEMAAYFAHPYLDFPPEIVNSMELNKEEEHQIYDFLKSNKVLLRSVLFNGYGNFFVKSNIMSKLITRNDLFRRSYSYALNLKQDLLQVIAKFNENSIDNMFIKSVNGLPLDSDNFDILVREKDLIASIKILQDAGFTQLSRVREPYKWLFRYLKNEKEYLAIHLHVAVGWEGIKFADTADLWKGQRKLQIEGVEVGVPSQENNLLITIAHAFFENHQFSLNDLAYIIEDIHAEDLDWDYMIRCSVEEHWFNSFRGMLQLTDYIYGTLFGARIMLGTVCEKLNNADKKNNNRLPSKLIRQFNEKMSLPVKIPLFDVANHYFRKIAADHRTSRIEKIAQILSLSDNFLKRKFPFRRERAAFPVCFVGQDGTGKTIHAKYLLEELKERGIRVKYVWSRGTGLFLGPLLNLSRFALLNGRHIEEHKREGRTSVTLVEKEPLRSIWTYVLLADHLTKSLKVRLALASGSLVICDRSIFDTFVDVNCDLGKNLSEALKRTVERLAPQPKIVFLMDTEPIELVKRRKSVKLYLAKKKRIAYFEHLETKEGVKIINTCAALQRNREEILSNTLQAFYNFYR